MLKIFGGHRVKTWNEKGHSTVASTIRKILNYLLSQQNLNSQFTSNADHHNVAFLVVGFHLTYTEYFSINALIYIKPVRSSVSSISNLRSEVKED